MTRALRLNCAALAGIAGVSHAQRVTSSLDLGATSMRYADSVSANAAVLGPALTVVWPRGSFGASATFSQLRPGGWTSQGAADALMRMPLAGPFSGELSVVGGGSTHQDGGRTLQGIAAGRVHFAAASSAGMWAGVAAGRMSDGITARGVRQTELGAWASPSGQTLMASVTPTVVDDTIQYTDFQGNVQLASDRIEFTATVGTRSGAHLPTLGGRATTWGSGNLVWWLAPSVGITAGAGSYPVDLTQGFPGGRFATAGLRLRWRSVEAVPAVPAVPVVPADRASPAVSGAPTAIDDAPRGTLSGFSVVTTAGRPSALRVRAPSANVVEVSGDFTGWRPRALTRAADGWWTTDVALAAGVHQLNVRVDGGAWLVPPGLNVMTDEFGGSVGLVIIP
jgi:hypothetical protein